MLLYLRGQALIGSSALDRFEEATLALEGRAGGAKDHVDTVAFFSTLADASRRDESHEAAPWREGALWIEGLRGRNRWIQQNLLLRVNLYDGLPGVSAPARAGIQATRDAIAADLARAAV